MTHMVCVWFLGALLQGLGIGDLLLLVWGKQNKLGATIGLCEKDRATIFIEGHETTAAWLLVKNAVLKRRWRCLCPAHDYNARGNYAA